MSAPASIADDDILIISVLVNYGGATLTGKSLPSGFTELWNTWQATSGDHWVVGWKRASSESGSYTFAWTADTQYVYADGIIAAYSGANTGTVIDASGASASATTDTHHVAPSANATYTNDFWIAMACEDNYSASALAGFNERFDNTSYSAKLYDKTLSASGATGTADIVMGSGNGRAGTILLIDATPTGGGGGLSIPVAMAQYRQRWN